MPLSKRDILSIYNHIEGHTLASPYGIMSLIQSVEYILENNIPGALLECGVFVGGNIQAMIKVLKILGHYDRDIWAYDTFSGMPKPQEIDIEFKTGPAIILWEKNKFANSEVSSRWVRYTLRKVMEQITPLEYPAERLHFIKGMVEKTVPKHLPGQIALARFDTDFYSSTKHEFEHIYPRVSSGGIIFVDDYGAFLGSKTATDEYIKENNLNLHLEIVDSHIRRIVKP
jgi:O-methyltransferase